MTEIDEGGDTEGAGGTAEGRADEGRARSGAVEQSAGYVSACVANVGGRYCGKCLLLRSAPSGCWVRP